MVDCGALVVVCWLCCGVCCLVEFAAWCWLCVCCYALAYLCYLLCVFAMCVDVRSVLFVVCRVVRVGRRSVCCLSFVVCCWLLYSVWVLFDVCCLFGWCFVVGCG